MENKVEMAKITMSSADWERNEQRHERREKRLIWLVALLIILLVGTNAGWLIRESQFEVVEETTETVTTTYEDVEQSAETGGNNIIGGDYNGETESREDND